MKSRQFLESGPLNSSTWGKRHPPPLSPLVVFVSALSTRSGWVAWGRTRCASILCIFKRLDFGFLKENSPVNVWLKWVTCRTKCGLVFCIFANRGLGLEWLIFIHILVFNFFPWYYSYLWICSELFIILCAPISQAFDQLHCEQACRNKWPTTTFSWYFVFGRHNTDTNSLFRPSTASILLRRTGKNN